VSIEAARRMVASLVVLVGMTSTEISRFTGTRRAAP
jgi:hypothetical protein